MKKVLLKSSVLIAVLFLLIVTDLKAQCSAGFSTATVNWDWLDYLVSSGNYAPNANYPGVPLSLAQSQAFAMGKRRLVITNNFSSANILGENTINTAEAGSYGAGADVQFKGNGTITLTFDSAVSNLKFSMYDLDYSQVTTITASNGGTPVNVTMAKLSGTVLTIAGSGTPTAIATALATTVLNTNTDGTINVDVAGPLTSVTIVVTGTATCSSSCGTGGTENGDFWLSDLSACVSGSFPTNYFVDAKPFTGQPTFILSTPDSNAVSYIDTATAKAKFLFSGDLASDANAPKFVNGLAYDHKKHYLYYVHDFGTNAYNTRTLRRWDYNTEAIDGSMAVDVNTIGIPTFDYGVESAGSSFYDGSLYFGVEGSRGDKKSGRESIIWRVDFDASNVPYRSSQVWATPADNGSGTGLHDWNDFVIKDGVLYDFDGAGSTSQDDYYHFNMQTGTMLQDYTTMPSYNTPRQTAITWAGTILWVYDSIGVYNEAGSVGTKNKILGTTLANMSPDWAKGVGPGGGNIGASGDAAGPFKTKTDFGDAPASYDPVTGDPATHEKDSTLRIGGTFDREFAKVSSVNADGDGADEDGVGTVNILSPGSGVNYQAVVSVYNHIGTNATLIAWLDYNGNGVFDAGETDSVAVASGTSQQNITLNWTGINVAIPAGTSTYMRIRITSTTNGMTRSKPTGYFNNGEVEDYRVYVDVTLPSYLKDFNASIFNKDKVKINWISNEDNNLIGYEVQKSNNALNWDNFNYVKSNGLNNPGEHEYDITDTKPNNGITYYRLKLNFANGQFKYSDVKSVNITNLYLKDVALAPNPARSVTTVFINGSVAGTAIVKIMNLHGEVLYSKNISTVNGVTKYEIPLAENWQSGTYLVQVISNGIIINKRLMINR
ncbi:MAG: T9SS type A sorting domain-containing protein [Sphingobacteriales bacterium]|nr:T9SS type A sorting domain-containing protein [Sphingobacteriales bacterium]